MLKKITTTVLTGLACAAIICLLAGCRAGSGSPEQEKEAVSDSSVSRMMHNQSENTATDRHLRFHEEK